MPRYHFHIWDGEEVLFDDEGAVFQNLGDAEKEAIASAREIMCEAILRGEPIGLSRDVLISDRKGTVVCRVAFKKVVEQ
jgi:hypothetical protein